MALKAINLAIGSGTATTHTVAAATAVNAATFNSGQSGFIHAIYIGGQPVNSGDSYDDLVFAPASASTAQEQLRLGSYLSEGGIITNGGLQTTIIVNIG